MFRLLLCLFILAGTSFAQAGSLPAAFAREVPVLHESINNVISSSIPGRGLLQPPKAAYIEGFGIVVTLEAVLEPSRNPFSTPKTPEEVLKLVTERRQMIREKLEKLLSEQIRSLTSLGPSESLAVVVHLFNSYPLDLPNLPTQLVFTAKKQEPSRVTIREF